MSEQFEPRIVGFLCNWCSYAGADLAGTSRIPYPTNIRIIRVPCSGRVDPLFVLKAFQEGADGVLVAGCHPGDCHYGEGNYHARRRYALMHRFLDFVGIEADRLRIDWVSASEGARFAQVVTELTERVRELGPIVLRPMSYVLCPTSDVGRRTGDVGRRTIERRTIQELQAKAKQLLAEGEVSCVIGYEIGPRGQVRPAFVYQPEEVERLVWNQNCTHNLVNYLHDRKAPPGKGQEPPRVGIVVKPCDARALNVLFHEQQIARERVFIIGMACEGICDQTSEACSERSESISEDPLLHSGQAFGSVARLQARCQRCTERVPVIYDALVGQPPEVEPVDEEWADIAELEALTPQERLAFWAQEFERCIRCYACRQVCPGCYCFECMAEQLDPLWVGIGIDVPEKTFFHVMRAYHLAGRCVDCAECERVCPMGIPVNLLNRKIAKEVAALFGYRTGEDATVPPPLATFRKDEDLPL